MYRTNFRNIEQFRTSSLQINQKHIKTSVRMQEESMWLRQQVFIDVKHSSQYWPVFVVKMFEHRMIKF